MSLNDKCVLVTGHTGFIGTHLVSALKKQGVDVLTLSGRKGHRLDVRDWEKIREIRENVDLIYHLAAKSYTPECIRNPRETYEINFRGTLNILDLCRLKDITKVVFTSTYVYGKPLYLPVDEKHPVNADNPYRKSKFLAEQLCQGYAESYNIQSVVLRLFNVYGSGQNENFLIPTILNQLKNKKIELNESKSKRDYIYIADVVDALMKAGQYDKSQFEIFNIGGGVSHSVKEIVDLILKTVGQKKPVNYLENSKQNYIKDIVADNSKAKRLLNWSSITSLDEGIKATIH